VLVFSPREGIATARQVNDGWYVVFNHRQMSDGEICYQVEATHWMPLPEPPTEKVYGEWVPLTDPRLLGWGYQLVREVPVRLRPKPPSTVGNSS
jgi:hypothetical protein